MSGSIQRSGLQAPPVGLLHGVSLFLDFDGTLVDIAPDPARVAVTEELRGLLAQLQQRLAGRVAILTGRSAADVEGLIAPIQVVVGGSHGLETRIEGCGIAAVERPASLDSVVTRLKQLERDFPGVMVEDKPLGVALHYRQAPEAEGACHDAAIEEARSGELELQPGKMVFELKAPGGDKGLALKRIMAEPPFAGSLPVFVGDDLTDEPGFTAAGELGGYGILVGEERETAAAFRLATVGDALGWLHQAVADEP